MEVDMFKNIVVVASVAFCFMGNCMNSSINAVIEQMYRCEQNIKTESFISGADLESQQKKLVSATRKMFISGIVKLLPKKTYVDLLPSQKRIDSLSKTQREAVVLFALQLDDYGKLNNINTYLLSAAINILSEESCDSTSVFILGKMIEKTPKEFLEGSEFL